MFVMVEITFGSTTLGEFMHATKRITVILQPTSIMNLIFYLHLKDKHIFGKFITNTGFVSIIYACLFAVRSLAGRGLIYDTVGLNIYSPFGPLGITEAYITTLLLWLIPTVMLASCLFSFFEDKAPAVVPVVRFISPLVCVLGIIALPTLNRGLDGELFQKLWQGECV